MELHACNTRGDWISQTLDLSGAGRPACGYRQPRRSWVQVLDILEDWLVGRGVGYLRIDGSVGAQSPLDPGWGSGCMKGCMVMRSGRSTAVHIIMTGLSVQQKLSRCMLCICFCPAAMGSGSMNSHWHCGLELQRPISQACSQTRLCHTHLAELGMPASGY